MSGETALGIIDVIIWVAFLVFLIAAFMLFHGVHKNKRKLVSEALYIMILNAAAMIVLYYLVIHVYHNYIFSP